MGADGAQTARTVLVTGAGGGLGAVMVRALLADGHSVAGVDADASALARLHGSLADGAGRLKTFHADIADPEAGPAAVRAAAETFGNLHGVINNAGIGSRLVPGTRVQSRPALDEIPLPVWDRFFAVNVRAPMLVTQAALPFMHRAAWGRIINVTTSFRSMLGALPYGATKAALESMSAVWAAELIIHNITVNVLIPGGPTDTPFVPDIGMERSKMLRPAIMSAPVRWLFSDDSNGFHGRRITAARWRSDVPGIDAARAASRPVGWPELAGDAIWGASAQENEPNGRPA